MVDDDPDRPTLRKHAPAADEKGKKKPKESGSGVEGMDQSLNDDPNRPTLRRGRPVGETVVPQLDGLPPDLHQVIAVSDAAEHDPHPFARAWESQTERATILAAFEAQARTRAAAYLASNNLKPLALVSAAPPPPIPGKTRRPVRPTPAPPLALADEQLSGFTLSYGGLPTFVYTAEINVQVGGPVYLTAVAQRLPSGQLQIGLTSLTDATHLDRTPWMRLVDAAEVDASHRGSFLFEMRAQSTRQFAVYRFVTAQAEQTFISSVIQ